MPPPLFFQNLGLFVYSDFLKSQYRIELCRHLTSAPSEKAVVIDLNGVETINLGSRNVDICLVSKELTAPLLQRLLEIKPDLEKHFGMRLIDCEDPQYLNYDSGDFFKPHQDIGGYEGKHAIRCRRVSVVIFLNRESEEQADGAYGGGQLTFYGLLEGPQWETLPLSLNAEPGLLIAFPSDKWHEVKPVSHGRRLTVVTWFHAAETPTAVGVKVKSAGSTAVLQ